MKISIGGAELNYEIAGAGETLVLLHEIGGTLETWTAVATGLAHRFQVLRYDQRGCGRSDKISGAFSLETHIDDLRALLAVLGIAGPVHLAGGAIGSALAVRFAAKFPAMVRSLVLACPAMNVSPDRVRYLHERAATVEAEGMAATVEASLGNSYPPEVITDRAAYDAYRARFLANDPASYAAINRAFATFDAMPDLSRIGCPALVLAGKHDRLRPLSEVRNIAAEISGAELIEIKSGHVMPVQAPNAMTDAMGRFYDRVA